MKNCPHCAGQVHEGETKCSHCGADIGLTHNSQDASAEKSGLPAGRQQSRVWLIVLLILCVAILVHGVFFSASTTGDLLYLIGYRIPSALLIWCVFYFSLRGRGTRGRGWMAFGLIFASLLAGDLIGYAQHREVPRGSV